MRLEECGYPDTQECQQVEGFRRSPLSLIEVLDAAQTQLDEAEQLFCAGQLVPAQSCIERACAILGGHDEV